MIVTKLYPIREAGSEITSRAKAIIAMIWSPLTITVLVETICLVWRSQAIIIREGRRRIVEYPMEAKALASDFIN